MTPLFALFALGLWLIHEEHYWYYPPVLLLQLAIVLAVRWWACHTIEQYVKVLYCCLSIGFSLFTCGFEIDVWDVILLGAEID